MWSTLDLHDVLVRQGDRCDSLSLLRCSWLNSSPSGAWANEEVKTSLEEVEGAANRLYDMPLPVLIRDEHLGFHTSEVARRLGKGPHTFDALLLDPHVSARATRVL
jgi:hypothetical protein